MNTVYVVQNSHKRDAGTGAMVPVHDLSPALHYGTLKFLMPPGPVLLSTEHAMTSMKQQLADFSDRDYLLCVGDPAVISLASMVASSINNGVVNLLVWDRQSKTYIPILINLYRRAIK